MYVSVRTWLEILPWKKKHLRALEDAAIVEDHTWIYLLFFFCMNPEMLLYKKWTRKITRKKTMRS